MIHKKLHAFYEKHIIFGYIITVVALIIALVGIIGVWAVNKYWHPPLLQFSEIVVQFSLPHILHDWLKMVFIKIPDSTGWYPIYL